MNTNFGYLTVELVIGFLALIFLTKILGKTQINQLTPFDFISALVLGELVGNAIYDKDIGVNYVLYAVFTWGILISLVEWITQKWRKTRGLLEGKPAIVIHNGLIDRDALQKNKLDINQLQHLLRNKNIFSIQEVEYAVLEANGIVNVLQKHDYQKVSNKDLKIPHRSVGLPISIISDGQWIHENITQTPFLRDNLESILKKNGINVKHVLFCEWTEGQPLYIQLNHAPFVKEISILSEGGKS